MIERVNYLESLTDFRCLLNFLGGGEPFFPCTRAERATRCLIVGFFVGPPLFVLVELSPTAWAGALAIALLANNPRLLLSSRAAILSHLSLAFFSLAALAALSAFWSLEPARSLKASFQFTVFVLMGGAVVSQLISVSAEQHYRIWNALVAGATIAIITLAIIEIRAWSFDKVDTTLIRSFHKTTFYGLFFAAILLFPSGRYLQMRRVFVLFFYALPTLLIGRTSGVNLSIILAVPLFFLSREGLKSVLTIFCLMYFVAALASPFIVERVYQSVDSSKIAALPQVSSYMSRLELWKDLAPTIKGAPWFGHGADTTRSTSVSFDQMKYYGLPDIPSAHNMVFDIWHELGLVGIVALLLIVLAASRTMMHLQTGSLLVTTIMLLGTILELSVDHRIWLSWVQGSLIFMVAASVLASLQTAPGRDLKRTIAADQTQTVG